MGADTEASGFAATAIGNFTIASGNQSTAVGYATTASGDRSVTMGAYASANGFPGASVFGDSSTIGFGEAVVMAGADNQFVVRAAGGTTFYSSADLSTGVSLAAGGGAWDIVSDARMKTNFRDLDGDDVLARLARIPIREWNYITQDASIRHVGPTAQDFHAAFGLGGNDRRISTLDPDGISLKAIQALDARTQQQHGAALARIAALERELAALRDAIAALARRQ